jgi:hypothetical protein
MMRANFSHTRHHRRQGRKGADSVGRRRATVVLPEPGGPHSTISQVPSIDHPAQRAARPDQGELAGELVSVRGRMRA